MNISLLKQPLSMGIMLCLLTAGWNCLEPNRFELDVNGPDGLLSFVTATSISAAGAGIGSAAGTVTLSQTAFSVNESTSASVDYTIALSAAPAEDVTVTIAPNQFLNIFPSSVTFTAADWDVPRQIRVSAADNNRRHINDIVVELSHALSSRDSAFNDLSFNVTVTITGDNERLIFLTHITYNGNLGSANPAGESYGGADEKCNADPNKPAGSGNFMALISGQLYYDAGAVFVSRAACYTGGNCASDEVTGVGTRTWSLKPNTNYVRVDNTFIGTTNAARWFNFPLTNSFSDLTRYYWSGLTTGWTLQATGSTCYTGSDAWSSAAGSLNGFIGRAFSRSASSIAESNVACTSFYHLVCVEQ